MATLRPLAPDASGVPKVITAPDTIDPAILPASSASGVPLTIASGSTFTVPTNIQMFAPLDIIVDGELVLDGEMVFG